METERRSEGKEEAKLLPLAFVMILKFQEFVGEHEGVRELCVHVCGGRDALS